MTDPKQSLRILSMAMDGQAFLEDSVGNSYYKHRLEDNIKPLDQYDLHPMNLQNHLPLDHKLYENEIFGTLDEANNFISKISLNAKIEDMKGWNPEREDHKETKERSIRALEQELAKYNMVS